MFRSQNAVEQQPSPGGDASSPAYGPGAWKMEVATPPAGGATNCCSCSCGNEKKSSQRKWVESFWNLIVK